MGEKRETKKEDNIITDDHDAQAELDARWRQLLATEGGPAGQYKRSLAYHYPVSKETRDKLATVSDIGEVVEIPRLVPHEAMRLFESALGDIHTNVNTDPQKHANRSISVKITDISEGQGPRVYRGRITNIEMVAEIWDLFATAKATQMLRDQDEPVYFDISIIEHSVQAPTTGEDGRITYSDRTDYWLRISHDQVPYMTEDC
jgi:hypothetical protein